MATTYNISCDQGATLRRVVTWTDEADNPVDLTGYTARMHVRETVDATETVLECTTENGRVVLGGAAGTIEIVVEASAMEAITAPFTYRYDLELAVGATPDVVRLIEGKFKVSPEVTR